VSKVNADFSNLVETPGKAMWTRGESLRGSTHAF
jgi:hypothetical protein